MNGVIHEGLRSPPPAEAPIPVGPFLRDEVNVEIVHLFGTRPLLTVVGWVRMPPFWVAAAMTIAVNASTNPPSLLCKLSGAIPVGYGRGTPLRVGLINFVGLASRPAAAAIVRHARVSVVASEPRARAARRGSVGVVICRTRDSINARRNTHKHRKCYRGWRN